MTKHTVSLIGLTAAGLMTVGTLQPAVAGPPPAPAGDAPQNIIYVIVDGFGPAQIELARRMNGGSLALLDTVPWQTTTTIDSSSLEGVTDSAAGATALASGVETLNGWVGMEPTTDGAVPVETILERAEKSGMATGLISDSYITDATPAAFAAHVTDRGQTKAIASQMATQGIEFLFGGGLRQGGVADLLDDAPGVTYVSNQRQMDSYVSSGGSGPVYGLFNSWNMAYNLDRDDEGVTRTEPTLPQMTTAALDVLSQDGDGYFLMVEAGLVDWAGHARDAGSLGSEMIEGDAAVRAAWNWVNANGAADDTLIVLTGDHETGGLALSPGTNISALNAQRATTEYMWGAIVDGASISATLKKYTGITPTKSELSTVRTCGEHGISDVLADRWGVTWNGTCTDEGDHTDVPVPLFAHGPGSGALEGDFYDNEVVGSTLLSYVS